MTRGERSGRKRSRQSWATRPMPPVTAERIETYLDLVARLMDRAGRDAELYLPIWRRLNLELGQRREADALLAAARSRLTRAHTIDGSNGSAIRSI